MKFFFKILSVVIGLACVAAAVAAVIFCFKKKKVNKSTEKYVSCPHDESNIDEEPCKMDDLSCSISAPD